jgi:hypothetical protein
MKIYEENQFKENCIKGCCYKGSLKSKNCLKEYKQIKCYEKYLQNIVKEKEPFSENIIRQRVLERDKTCRVWNILNDSEKDYINTNFFNEYKELGTILDTCHIISRNTEPSLIVNMNNAFLASRYFHTLLDAYQDLITQKAIYKEERIKWIERIMHDNGIWDKNYTYNDLYSES